MVQDDPDMGWRERYDARGTEEILAGEGAEGAAATADVNVLGGGSVQDATGA
jgi:hypothetical protein